jgi:capsular exopolysaccharide synthesis family protein
MNDLNFEKDWRDPSNGRDQDYDRQYRDDGRARPPGRRDSEPWGEEDARPGDASRGRREPSLPALAPQHVRAGRQVAYYDEPHLPVFAPDAAYAEQPTEGFSLDLRKYWWLLVKHRWLIAGITAVFVVGGFFTTFLTTPIYRATASIQIERQTPNIVDMSGMQMPVRSSLEFYQTQYELLKSRSLGERVVSALDLVHDPAFMQTRPPSILARIKQAVFRSAPAGEAGATPAAEDAATVAARQRGAGYALANGLVVETQNNSSIFRLSYASTDAGLAQRIVNGYQDAFIAENLERRFQSTGYARTFLEDQLQQLKVKLEESEKALVDYADKQSIVDAGGGQSIALTNLNSANSALTDASRARLQLELTWKQIQETGGESLPDVMNSPTVQALRAKRADLQADYQDKLKTYKPGFPDMLKLRAQIDEMSDQIKAEIEVVKQSIKNQLDAAVAKENSLAGEVEKLKGSVVDFRNRNIQYNILQREADTNRQLYDGLLQRYKEIGVAADVGVNNISIVDRAEKPGAPFTPNLKANLAKALVLGLFIGGLAAFGREQLDDSFRSPEDIEEHLRLPLLGIIPRGDKNADMASTFDDPRSPISEAYRSLRTALQFSTASGMPRTLLVTSSRASEGKSTSAVMLSRNFAQMGLRVLLIDGDLRKPSLHNYFGCDDTAGLTNCLAGSIKPPEVFQETDLPTLTFLPCGPLPPNPAELLAGPKMYSLLSIAAQKFDLVIVDGPPVAGLADAPLLASMTMGTLLVVEAGKTRRKVAKTSLKRLHFARGQLVGVVLNKLDLASTGHSYGYGYGYGDENYYGYGADRERQARLSDNRGGDEV